MGMSKSDPGWADVGSLILCESNNQFIIPVYQRNYVWDTKKQVKQLLEDYTKLLGNELTHFIGIVIYYQAEGGKHNNSKFYVIDGQQRMTTLFLLTCALKQRASDENDTYMVGTLSKYLTINNRSRFSTPDLKLKLLMNDGNVYNKIVEGHYEKLSSSEKKTKIAIAYDYICKYVSNELSSYDLDDLMDALSRLYLVEIPLNKDDNAQQIFESINATGSPLLATDLIRNYILMCIADDKKDEIYSENWQPLEAKFSSSSALEDFFRFFVINQTKEFVNKKEVYESFRKWFDGERMNNDVDGIIGLMTSYADIYNKLYITDLNEFSSEKMWKIIKDFRNIETTMPAPFMMEMLYLLECKKITENQFVHITQIINSFILRRAIIGLDTSGISRFFYSLLKNVFNECADNYSDIVEVVKYYAVYDNQNKGSRFPSDDEIRTSLSTANVYDNSLALHCLFDKIENERLTQPSFTMKYQIEHIMPQNGSKWQYAGLKQEVYDKEVNRLGNLTLTTSRDNPIMSNNLFEYKQEILKDTAHFKLNVDVYNAPKWDVEEINSRTDKLIEDLLRLYPFEIPQNPEKYKKNNKKSNSKEDSDRIALWKAINEILADNELFDQRLENGTRGYFDFNYNKPYHCFIAFWDYNKDLLQIGLWFANKNNINFNIFIEHIDELRNSNFNYEIEAADDKKCGSFVARIKNPDFDNEIVLQEFAKMLLTEIIRIHDFTLKYHQGKTSKPSIAKVTFKSELTGLKYYTTLDENGNPCIKDVETNTIPWHGNPSQKEIISDFLLSNDIEPKDTTHSQIRQLIAFLYDDEKTDNWIIPCNKNYYDIEKAFKMFKRIDYKQSTNVNVGDIVYIYVSGSNGGIQYKCKAVEVNKPISTIDDSSCAIGAILDAKDYSDYGRYMELEFLSHIVDERLSFEKLKENGLKGSVQGPIKVIKSLDDYLNNIFK